jgi:hypothetical protein
MNRSDISYQLCHPPYNSPTFDPCIAGPCLAHCCRGQLKWVVMCQLRSWGVMLLFSESTRITFGIAQAYPQSFNLLSIFSQFQVPIGLTLNTKLVEPMPKDGLRQLVSGDTVNLRRVAPFFQLRTLRRLLFRRP